jgi:hypothetical protein
MALKGNLKDFNLSEIFQLITMGKKTGALVLAGDEASGTIYFNEGSIYAAFTHWKAEPIEVRIQKASGLKESDLQKLKAEAEKAGKKLGEYLIEKKVFSVDDLKALLAGYLADSLFDLFTWKEGDFYFESGKKQSQADLGITVDIPSLMKVAEKRLEEWRKIKEKIPSLDLYFCWSLKPAEGNKDIVLKPIEWRGLYYLNGQHDVRALADLMELSEFEVCRVLYRLVADGLVEKAEKPKGGVVALKRVEEEKPREAEVVKAPSKKDEKKAEEEVKAKGKVEEKEAKKVKEAKPAKTEDEIRKKADEVVEEITARITQQLIGGVAKEKGQVEVEIEKKEEVSEEQLEEMLEELTALTEGAGEAVEEVPAKKEAARKESEVKEKAAEKVGKKAAEPSAKPEEPVRIKMDENISRELVLEIIKGIKRL